jgi:hypothetical protein
MKIFKQTTPYAKLILLGLLTAVFLLVSCAPAAVEPVVQTAALSDKPVFVFDRTPDDVDAHTIEYYMSPTCGCCGYHADAFTAFSEEIGYDLQILMHDSSELYPIKEAAGVPTQFYSCHTAFADGYFPGGPCTRKCGQLAAHRKTGRRGRHRYPSRQRRNQSRYLAG